MLLLGRVRWLPAEQIAFWFALNREKLWTPERMEPLLSLSLSLSLFLHPAEASVLGGVHTTNAAGRILNHKFMRVSGRNRRQSYRGYGPTMAFWLPLNASVLFLPFFFFRETRLSTRESLPSNLTALYVTLCRLHFLSARIVRHSSIPVTELSAFFSWITSFETFILLFPFLFHASFAGDISDGLSKISSLASLG